MISKSFKKQLIINAYNTQFDTDKVDKDFFSAIKRTINFLLFRIDDKSLYLEYKLKSKDDINYDILWFLTYLTSAIYSVYNYSDKITDIQNTQEDILSNIEYALDRKHRIEDNPDYVEYLEDIYD